MAIYSKYQLLNRAKYQKGEIMEIMTVNEVADYLKIKTQTVYLWKSQKKMPFVEMNGSVRFDKEDIDAWVRSQKKAN